MQNSTHLSYQKIIQEFKNEHRRGVAVFEKIYGNQDSELYFILCRREWHRFYLFKKCVKYLEKHIEPRFAVWLLDRPTGKQMLSEMLKNITQLSPKGQFFAQKWLDMHQRWGASFKRTESKAETGTVSTVSISACVTGEHETKIDSQDRI